ncbi:hypothetical protein [Pseudolactococcus insecticola]|nr:hypothetical protein [Lactococcus insecticola]
MNREEKEEKVKRKYVSKHYAETIEVMKAQAMQYIETGYIIQAAEVLEDWKYLTELRHDEYDESMPIMERYIEGENYD